MKYLGDFTEDDPVTFTFNTHVSGTPTTLAGTPVLSVYKGSNTTEVTTGVTLTVDYDGRTGLHHVAIVTTDAFYAVANDYRVVITTGTVGGNSVVGVTIAEFSIENRNIKANVVEVNGEAATAVENELTVATGTIGSTGNSTTALHLTGLTFGDDELNNLLIAIRDVSASETHFRWIEDWADTGDLATVATLPFTPENAVDTYTVLGIRRDVDVVKWLGTAVATPTVAGVPEVDLQTIKGQTVTCSAAVTVSPFVGNTGSAFNGTTLTSFIGNDGLVQWATMLRGSFEFPPVDATTLYFSDLGLASGTISTVTDYYKGCFIKLIGGTGKTPGGGQIRRITGSTYDTDHTLFTIKRPFAVAPDANTTFVILPSEAGLLTGDVDADAVKADAVTEIQSGLATQTSVNTLTAIFTGITSLAQWLGLIAGKQTGNSTARTELQATGAGSGTFDETTDSMEAVRDAIPNEVKRNTAFADFPFKMVLASDHLTAATGLTVTAQRKIDNGSFAACANSPTEDSDGWYAIDLAAADLNGKVVTLRFTEGTADTTEIVIVTQPG